MNSNDVILKTAARAIVYMILAFSIYLFFAGHNSPGGGFIGGLVTSSALVLLYLVFDMHFIREALPFNYIHMTALGLFLAVATGFGALLFDVPFLTHTFGQFNLPVFGENTELATATIFDLGVYLTVVGVTMTIILAVGEDE